jgi:uncharacterized protein YukE
MAENAAVKDSVLAVENIEAVKNAVKTYIQTCSGIFEKMQNTIATLRGKDFVGDASNGYEEFFTQITPALTTNLYLGDESLMVGINNMMDSIKATLLDTVDPELEAANKNAAGNNPAPAPKPQ